MAEHIVDDEGTDDPDVQAWFDDMADRHNAEEAVEQVPPERRTASLPDGDGAHPS